MVDFHQGMMRRALTLARKGLGRTAPNPAVGCVIVKDGVCVGSGWHRKAGTPHAEVHALREAGDSARGADVYVTLEPCSHHGRTPPCAEALIAAGVSRVYAGMVDPNPQVCGRGVEMLRGAGIEVHLGLLGEECRLLNESFIKHVQTGMPFVISKCALTLDGKIATARGDSRWITNEKSRHHVHRIRAIVDAVMIGSGTAIADDPQLTCRACGGRDPLRVVVDSRLTTPVAARLFNQPSAVKTIVATAASGTEKIRLLEQLGVEVITCPDLDGRVDLRHLLSTLGKRGVQSILLEGGGVLAGEMLRSCLIDKFMIFYAPKLLGGDGPGPFMGEGVPLMEQSWRLRNVTLKKFGSDFLLTGYAENQCSPVL